MVAERKDKSFEEDFGQLVGNVRDLYAIHNPQFRDHFSQTVVNPAAEKVLDPPEEFKGVLKGKLEELSPDDLVTAVRRRLDYVNGKSKLVELPDRWWVQSKQPSFRRALRRIR